ncbi:MAG: site-2 protease family protein [Bacteriovoracia bacterium]
MNFDPVEIFRNILIFMPAFLFALVVHEYAHAWMATKFGDNTSEWSGRLTMNPTAHIDPLGTLIFPIASIAMGSHIFFGWAKPVPINPSLFSSYRKGLFWVAFAGPLSNIITGFLSAFLLVGFLAYVPRDFAFYAGAQGILESFLMLNFSLAIFNLLPVPPLDGSNIVLSFLSYNASQKFMAIQQYANILLIFMLFTGALSFIRIPIILLVNLSLNLATSVFGFALPGYSG